MFDYDDLARYILLFLCCLTVTTRTSWRSGDPPPCLGGASHGWVPVNTHSTGAVNEREAVGGSAPTTNISQDVSRQEFRQTW